MSNSDDKSKLFETLDSVQSHIRLLDNKAVGLLTAIGVVFSLSLFSIDNILFKENSAKLLIYIFGSIYLFCFFITIVLLVVSLFPMRKKKNGLFYPRYVIDIYNASKKEDFKKVITSDISDEQALDQIKICSRIAFIKETCVRISAYFIITGVASLIVVITAVFF